MGDSTDSYLAGKPSEARDVCWEGGVCGDRDLLDGGVEVVEGLRSSVRGVGLMETHGEEASVAVYPSGKLQFDSAKNPLSV